MPIHTSRRRAHSGLRARLLQTAAFAGAALAAGAAPALADTFTYADGEVREAPIVLTEDGELAVPDGEAQQIGEISETGGSWGVEKTGDGLLVLDSLGNTYSGGTTISGGTLAAARNTDLGADAGLITLNGGELILSSSSDFARDIVITGADGAIGASLLAPVCCASPSISGTISGPGALTVTGDGTLSLTGANTYAGGTTIASGSLQLHHDSAAGTGAITLAGGQLNVWSDVVLGNDIVLATDDPFIFASGDAEAAGDISQTGGARTLRITGDLTLSGQNSYSGGTLIEGGTVSVASDANLGAASGDLTFDLGNLRLTGDLDTMRDMTLLTDTGFLPEAGVDAVFGGVISGEGGFGLVGPGAITLTGANSFTGPVVIDGGLLRLDGGQAVDDMARVLFTNFTPGGASALTILESETIGSIEGAGTVEIAAGQTLTTGGSGESTTLFGTITGDGALVKTGAGVLTLTGDNTYGGGTTIRGGALSVSANANLGSEFSDLTFDGGTLHVADSFEAYRDLTITENGGTVDTDEGVTFLTAYGLEGTGVLRKTGAGTHRIRTGGSGDFTGTFSVEDGVLDMDFTSTPFAHLVVAEGGTVRAGAADFASISGAGNIVVDGNSITILGNETTEFSGVISGDGRIELWAEGVLTLSGQNTYSGGTVINQGRLRIASDANLGDLTGGVRLNGGVVELTESITSTRFWSSYGGAIETPEGTTSVLTDASADILTKLGAGRLVLNAPTSFHDVTLAEGVLELNGQPVSANMQRIRFEGGTLALTGSDNTLDHLVSVGAEGGTLDVAGGLTLDLTNEILGAGALTKTGGGALILSGDSAGVPLFVTGGTLVASGDYGAAVDIANGAVLSGTGQVGALTANGTIAPGNSIGTLTVAGDATLGAASTYQAEIAADGTSDLLAIGGEATLEGGALQLVLVDSPAAYLDQTYTLLTADGGVTGTFADVSSPSILLAMDLAYGPTAVTLDVDLADFPALAATDNQAASGSGLQQFAATGDSQTVLESLFPLNQAGVQGAFDSASGEAHASFRLAGAQASELFQTALMGRVAPLSAPAGEGATVWASGMGEDGSVDADGNAASLDHNLTGLALGAEVGGPAGDGAVRAGAAIGMLDGEASVDDRASEAEIGAWQIGAYGAWQAGGLRLSGAASYGQAEIESTRAIAWSGLSRTATAERDADLIAAALEASWSLTGGANGFDIAPLALIDYVSASADAATETGADALNLALESEDYDRLEAGLGLAIGLRGDAFAFDARAAYRERLDGDMPVQTLAFGGSPNASFTVAGPDTGSSRITAGVGVSAMLSENLALSARYDGSFASDAEAHQAVIDLGWRF